MNATIPVDAAVRERDAVLAYLEKTRDKWRDTERRMKHNTIADAACLAKIAVIEGLIDDIRDGHHVMVPR